MNTENEIKVNYDGDEFIILDSFRQNNRTYCRVKFLKTNNTATFRRDQIIDGANIKDRLKRSVLGVGMIGNIKKVDYKKEYSIWNGMLDRCYNEKSNAYQQYGAKNVRVCERWLRFEYFVEDVPKIDGYDNDKYHNNELELDKDKKQLGQSNKIYSLETCTFIRRSENSEYRELLNQNADITGISPDGKIVEIKSVMLFAKEHGMIRSHIYECVNGNRQTHKKWKFYRKQDS